MPIWIETIKASEQLRMNETVSHPPLPAGPLPLETITRNLRIASAQKNVVSNSCGAIKPAVNSMSKRNNDTTLPVDSRHER